MKKTLFLLLLLILQVKLFSQKTYLAGKICHDNKGYVVSYRDSLHSISFSKSMPLYYTSGRLVYTFANQVINIKKGFDDSTDIDIVYTHSESVIYLKINNKVISFDSLKNMFNIEEQKAGSLSGILANKIFGNTMIYFLWIDKQLEEIVFHMDGFSYTIKFGVPYDNYKFNKLTRITTKNDSSTYYLSLVNKGYFDGFTMFDKKKRKGVEISSRFRKQKIKDQMVWYIKQHNEDPFVSNIIYFNWQLVYRRNGKIIKRYSETPTVCE